jgi:hypothetical protein
MAERSGHGGGEPERVQERGHGGVVHHAGERGGLGLLPVAPGHGQSVPCLGRGGGGVTEPGFQAADAGLENLQLIAEGQQTAARLFVGVAARQGLRGFGLAQAVAGGIEVGLRGGAFGLRGAQGLLDAVLRGGSVLGALERGLKVRRNLRGELGYVFVGSFGDGLRNHQAFARDKFANGDLSL